MTPDDVRAMIAQIATLDSKSAHIDEDGLWATVLQEIADGSPNAAELAAAALETKLLPFDRWYA